LKLRHKRQQLPASELALYDRPASPIHTVPTRTPERERTGDWMYGANRAMSSVPE